MRTRVNGLDVEMEIDDAGLPHVQVYMGDKPVLDTKALSSTGMRNLAAALEVAADAVYDGLDEYYYRLRENNGVRRGECRGNPNDSARRAAIHGRECGGGLPRGPK